jgi:hypothetical protein
VYLAATDSAGQFDIGPLPVGTYTVRALMDQNNNRMLDRGEKWDTTTVTVVDSRPHIELDAIERDTTPAVIETVTPLDTISLRVTFDKALDPRLPLQPALIHLQHADSSEIGVVQVQWQSDYDRRKAAIDSAHRADSIKAAAPPAVPTPAPPPPVAAAPPPTRNAPPPPKPRALPPDRGIVITIAPPARFTPNETYRVTIVGARNLVGRSSPQTRIFTVPKPPPPKITPDTAKKPPAKPPATPPPRPPRSIE